MGREVLGARTCGRLSPPSPFPGENLEGTVPARGRRDGD